MINLKITTSCEVGENLSFSYGFMSYSGLSVPVCGCRNWYFKYRVGKRRFLFRHTRSLDRAPSSSDSARIGGVSIAAWLHGGGGCCYVGFVCIMDRVGLQSVIQFTLLLNKIKTHNNKTIQNNTKTNK